jgi:hypothetical protein
MTGGTNLMLCFINVYFALKATTNIGYTYILFQSGKLRDSSMFNVGWEGKEGPLLDALHLLQVVSSDVDILNKQSISLPIFRKRWRNFIC